MKKKLNTGTNSRHMSSPSNARQKFLLSRIRASLGRRCCEDDMNKWRVEPHDRGGRSKYVYYHPMIQERFFSLTKAKLAYIRLVNQRQKSKTDNSTPHIIHCAGSVAAVDILRNAWWPGASSRANLRGQSAISEGMFHLLDVVVVPVTNPRHPDNRSFAIPDNRANWSLDGLVSKHGYLLVKRSCAIVSAPEHVVLGAYVLGRDLDDGFREGMQNMHAAHKLLSRCMIPGKRAGIWMFGLRFNPQEKCDVRMQTCYYRCRSPEAAIELDRRRDEVIKVAACICSAERKVSEHMWKRRCQNARACNSPGIYPAVPIQECPATSCGMSRSYRSPPHTDNSANMHSETIGYCSTGVPDKAGYVFAMCVARVVVSLTADSSCLVMVPGTHLHGTPHVRRGFDDHAGVGAVIISKADLHTDKARKDIAWLNWRIATGNAGRNPFMTHYARRTGMEVCTVCRRGDGEDTMLLCDVCNCGQHTECCGLGSDIPKGSFVCKVCAELL